METAFFAFARLRGEGVLEFLRRESPIFRSTTVLGREPVMVGSMNRTHFHYEKRHVTEIDLITRGGTLLEKKGTGVDFW